ncbi:unnamed protein product [Urochloa decumbens]|uniref:Uncharacterized protein n=1 Tax=Urochloa decumbens TaxID=240449 RepID=A0ABC9B3L0_9POAL
MGSRSQPFSSALLWFLVVLFPLSTSASSSKRMIYVVYMGEKQHDDPSMVTASHHAVLTSILGSKDEALKSIIYSYKHGFSGFAAKLTERQAEELKKYPGVVSVKPNTYHKLQTTRSWDFLGLSYDQPSSSGLLKKAKYGEDVIVGIIDSGIWPESRSFDDAGYGPVPKRWKGMCQTGQAFNATNCNRKIIGARWYNGDASAEDLKGEYMSARDFNGHGTHTASTVAGGPVRNASYGGGLAAGLARGGAPRARLAIYKACHGVKGGCGDASVLAAIDDAIDDGVDLLSLSIGGIAEYPGTLHAVARGVTVVFAAGNDGPAKETVNNAVPWVISVAAATIDRSFPTVITLGNGEKLVGQSLHHNHGAVSNSNDDDFSSLFGIPGVSCNKEILGAVNITGRILVCLSSTIPPGEEFLTARSTAIDGGAKGLIFAQYTTSLLEYTQFCEGYMPCLVVDKEIAYRILSQSTVAKISVAATVVGNQVAAPRVAAFSSRGPSPVFPAVLKPDIAAPGVAILAAKGDSFELMSGTSMACPHVSAVVALLKSVHPDWSPAMIKSAIVTTASVTDRFGMPIQADSVQRKPADPFDFGGGQINPDEAIDPGLVYDINPKEYIKFFNCTLGPNEDCSDYMGNLYQLNLPSIAIPNLKESVTVWRTVTNVGPEKVTYQAKVEAPAGVRMVVEPSVITFGKGGPRSVTFKVTFLAKQRVQGGYTFGSLTWLDCSKHLVRIPVAVRTIIQDFVADAS